MPGVPVSCRRATVFHLNPARKTVLLPGVAGNVSKKRISRCVAQFLSCSCPRPVRTGGRRLEFFIKLRASPMS